MRLLVKRLQNIKPAVARLPQPLKLSIIFLQV